MTSALAIRPLHADEVPLLRRVCYTAATFRPPAPGTTHPPLDELLARPHLACYVDGWGRPGDRALVAALDGEPVGGVFSRLFAPDHPAQGFVDTRTPELGIGLFDGSRSTGIGRALMLSVIAQARIDGYPAISLAVADDNRAMHLYESLGFRTHRVVEGGRIMLLPLR